MPFKQLGLICTSSCLPNLALYLRSIGFEVKALWCENQDIGISTAAELEIPFVASKPDEVLLRKEVEMVLIAAKPSLTALICEKALGIGKHVLCTSPATLTHGEALKMVQAAQYYPQILSLIGFGLRHLDIFQKMKQLLRRGYLGTPLICEARVHCSSLVTKSFDWFWEYEMGGGVLNLIGSQIIDLISVLLNSRANRVQGLVKTNHVTVTHPHSPDVMETGSDNADEEMQMFDEDREDKLLNLSSVNGFHNNNSSTEEDMHKRHSTPRPGRNTPSWNGFRKLNADDFASFLMKFPNPNLSATVTLNSLCSPSKQRNVVNSSSNSGIKTPGSGEVTSSSYSPGNTSSTSGRRLLCDLFDQEILICGTEGRLIARNDKLYGCQIGCEGEELLFDESMPEHNLSASLNYSTGSTGLRSEQNGGGKLKPTYRRKSSVSSVNSLGSPLSSSTCPLLGVNYANTAISWNQVGDIPTLYAKGFANLLETLSKAITQYSSTMERSAGSWKDFLPVLGTVAGFEDAQYVRAVIDAVRHSSSKGDWIRVNLDQG